MLDEVARAKLVVTFVRGPGVDPGLQGDDRRGAVLSDPQLYCFWMTRHSLIVLTSYQPISSSQYSPWNGQNR